MIANADLTRKGLHKVCIVGARLTAIAGVLLVRLGSPRIKKFFVLFNCAAPINAFALFGAGTDWNG